MVEGERFTVVAISRIEFPETSPRDISSRSESVNAKQERLRGLGRIPPVGDKIPKTEDDSLSNERPIELRDSPRC